MAIYDKKASNHCMEKGPFVHTKDTSLTLKSGRSGRLFGQGHFTSNIKLYFFFKILKIVFE